MKSYVGKNVLFQHRHAADEGRIFEGDVAELSPSGKRVKIGKQWYEVEKVTVLEELPKKPKKEVEMALTGEGATKKDGQK